MFTITVLYKNILILQQKANLAGYPHLSCENSFLPLR